MCDSNSPPSPLAAQLEPAAASSSSSLSFPCSASPRSRGVLSLPSDTARASEMSPASDSGSVVRLSTAERIYRCLGLARPARAGDVLLDPGQVSEATIRRWRRCGWLVKRQRLCITARGCAALPFHHEVVAFAQRSGRSTLFL